MRVGWLIHYRYEDITNYKQNYILQNIAISKQFLEYFEPRWVN